MAGTLDRGIEGSGADASDKRREDEVGGVRPQDPGTQHLQDSLVPIRHRRGHIPNGIDLRSRHRRPSETQAIQELAHSFGYRTDQTSYHLVRDVLCMGSLEECSQALLVEPPAVCGEELSYRPEQHGVAAPEKGQEVDPTGRGEPFGRTVGRKQFRGLGVAERRDRNLLE